MRGAPPLKVRVERPVGRGEGGTGRTPCAAGAAGRFHGRVAILTTRRLRAATGAIVLTAALAGGAIAAADGALDPGFNGGAPRIGTAAEGLAWSTQSLRIPAVVQADGRIVVGGQSGGAMTLARFNADGTLDTTYGTGGFVTARFAGTPTSSPGTSAATALALDPAGNVLAAGFGASQSMVVARFSPTGSLLASVVCFAPHLIDYTAYALAQRPDGSVVVAGQARDRWHGTPYLFYGARAVVQVSGGSAASNGCGTWSASAATGKPLGSSGVDGRRARPRRDAAQRRPRRADLPRRRRAARRLLRDGGGQRRHLELHRRRRGRHGVRQRRLGDDPDRRAARRARAGRRERRRRRRGHRHRARPG